MRSGRVTRIAEEGAEEQCDAAHVLVLLGVEARDGRAPVPLAPAQAARRDPVGIEVGACQLFHRAGGSVWIPRPHMN